MPSLIADAVMGSVVTFKSKASNDPNTYHGKIMGIVDMDVAKGYTDILSYNTNVQAVDATVGDLDVLTFWLIKLLTQLPDQTDKYIIPMATDWILESTFDIITTTSKAEILVFDVDEALALQALDILRAEGFKAKVARVY